MKPESEAAFQQTVINLAIYEGWMVYHPPENRPITTKSGRIRKQPTVPGFPDLTFLRDTEHMVVELKAEKGRLRPDQKIWLAAFEAAGVETHVWRPSEWAEISNRLARRGGVSVAALTPCPTCGRLHADAHIEVIG